MLALAPLDEVQGHHRDDAADKGSPRAKRTLCSRKRRDKDVLEHSKQLNTDPLHINRRFSAKNRYTWSLWCQKQVHSKAKYKIMNTPGVLRLASLTSYLFLLEKVRYTWFCLLYLAYRTREQDMKQCSTDLRLPYTPVYQTPPEKAQEKKIKRYKLDPTNDKRKVSRHPVEEKKKLGWAG